MNDTLVDTTVTESDEAVELTALDRCDRCGSQAYTIATLNGSTLLFCGHHTRAFSPGLIAAGFDIDDRTHLLHEDRLTGSEN